MRPAHDVSIFEEMLKSLEDVVFSYDPDGTLTYVSPSVKTMLGLLPEEVQSRNFREIAAPEYREEAVRRTRMHLQRAPVDQPWDLEVLARGGSRVWVQIRTKPVYDDGGKLLRVFGVARDVSRVKALEREVLRYTEGLERQVEERTRVLRESEERFKELVELLPETIFEMDLRGNLTFANRSALEHFGYTRGELDEGLHCLEMVHPGDRDRARENIGRVLKGQPPGASEYRAVRKDGTSFPCIIRSAQVVRDGAAVGLRGIIIDITDRVETERALRESRERYRQLLDHAPAGIYELDLERGRFLGVNDVMCEYTGYSKEEFLRMDPVSLLEGEGKKMFAERLARIASGEPVGETVEYRIRAKDGRDFWVELNVKVAHEGRRPRTAMVVAHDVTERKLLEEQLRQAQKMEAIGTLAGGIAHDFNNLLMGVQGHVSLILDGMEPSDPRYGDVKGIEEHVRSATDLTRQLLEFARGGNRTPEPTDLNGLVRKSAEMFRRTRKEIDLRLDLEDPLSTVEVDRGQIEQVLLNLYINAWQAMPGGGSICIRTANADFDEPRASPHGVGPGRYARVSVADTGVGMDSETLKRAFEPFFTTREKARGTGLGLASAYGIVKNHGGFIDVRSEKGEGATFSVYIPAAGRGEAGGAGAHRGDERLAPTGAPPPCGEAQGGAGGAGGRRVLLVDDEEMILRLGTLLLERLGYEVRTAKCGRDAVECFSEGHEGIDIVILDMVMPGLSGGETYERLKSIDPGAKILVASGYGIEDGMAETLRNGECGFIQKPFDLCELSAKLTEIAGGRKPR